MSERQSPQISSRKEPRQARANALVAAVLDAAVQVLRTEGAARFTTARVAERAGVSVGSLYQYFPNKAAILFRLQSDEWRQTSQLLSDILTDRERPPFERLQRLTAAFLRSECEEAAVRQALGDAAPLYRDAPEAIDAQAAGSQVIHDFVGETLPGAKGTTVQLAADLLQATLTQVGSSFSETPRSEQEITAYATAMADMFSAYLTELAGRGS
ncbi:TetR family transcriptional regulator [Altererythrobacter sp. B11]|uniref:TetR family transcriptional regulator n=1 Tax=Altererythrobacter sp. B11 TaxID=2060312 RepID=UPI000DC734D9|nr:TetR family transcriptional regulator [Altererythrobacter sp. B11]BBC74017.1 TetR family transcriptional regulator [Altererythrobacter sp. B11]